MLALQWARKNAAVAFEGLLMLNAPLLAGKLHSANVSGTFVPACMAEVDPTLLLAHPRAGPPTRTCLRSLGCSLSRACGLWKSVSAGGRPCRASFLKIR
jgi:hypothetical protein